MPTQQFMPHFFSATRGCYGQDPQNTYRNAAGMILNQDSVDWQDDKDDFKPGPNASTNTTGLSGLAG